MKISHNLKQDTSSKRIVYKQLKSKTKQMKENNVEKNKFNNKLERSHQKANTNTSGKMKISHNLNKDTSSKKNSSQTVEIKNKTCFSRKSSVMTSSLNETFGGIPVMTS